jgi:hypothetical protein
MESERERPPLVPTGDPRVDAAVAGLAAIDDLDLADRPAVLEDVHAQLRELLGELGDAVPPRPGEPGRRGEQGQFGAGAQPRQGTPAASPQPRQGTPGAGPQPRPGAGGSGSWSRWPDA